MDSNHEPSAAQEFKDVAFRNSRTAVLYHDDFIHHLTGSHPEHPRRLVVMRDAIHEHQVNGKLEWIEPRLCDEADILRCHTHAHLELVKRACERSVDARGQLLRLDPDTVVSPDTCRAANRAVGAVCQAVDMVVKEGYQSAWCLVRPPGHHATPERSMGFCIFNNTACAAAYARAVHNLERVMIVDYDLHHGNGTQEIFYYDSGVLYTSIHQSHHYPGTGYIDEIGEEEGRGYVINFPVPAGSGDSEFALYFLKVVAPIAQQYKPGLIVVSVGFDAHAHDHLGLLQVTSPEYGRITTLLRAVASELGVGIVYTLEGGYSLEVLGESVIECLVASTADEFDSSNLPFAARPSSAALETLEELREVHRGTWGL